MIFRVIIILIFLTSCTTDSRLSSAEKELVGIWQVIPQQASGWADVYRFFDNGEFIYHYSQRVCDNRTLNYSGTWESDNQVLKLKITKKTVLEGGKLVPAMGACASDFEIEGGEIKDLILSDSNVQTIHLSSIRIDNSNRDLKIMMFDGKPFWKLENDPNKY